MNPTAEQIRLAQEAGNDAYNHAVTDACKPWMCYEAYRAAYDATLAQLQEQDPLAGVNWSAIRSELDTERAEMVRRETAERRCTCGAGYLTIPRKHESNCALRQASAETGVTAEWLTPEQVARQGSDEMKRIAADAMRNQEPIEY